MISNKFYARIVVYGFACMIAVGPTLPAFAALPGGGKITTGKGSITVSGKVMTVKELSPTININWSSFNVGKNSTIDFLQPNSSSVAANFVGGDSASTIAGDIKANGKVFIFNPFGIAFLGSSKVDVAGLLAAGMKEASSAPNSITMTGSGAVSNAGTINVLPGGQVALVGSSVSNSGSISAPQGLITFGAGNNVSLDFSGSSILALNINSNNANATINNSGVLSASGGNIELKAGAVNSLVSSAVNNTGNVEANSITLLSGMQAGVTTVGGSLYAPGGQINTSGGRVNVLSSAQINTTSPSGAVGTWTIDPNSFYIGENTSGTANSTLGNVLNYEDISASSLETALNNSNVTILSTNGGKGTLGNVYVDSSVSYNSSNELKIDAVHNIEVNQSIVNAGTGEIRLRADDMAIGGTQTGTATGAGSTTLASTGVPTGNGAVYVNSGASISSGGLVSIYTNPSNYNTTLVNPGTAGGNLANGDTSGKFVGYDLISSINDLEYISNNQTSQVLANNYALNTNIGWKTNTTYNFTPIGLNNSSPFLGGLNGLNHTITNLYENSSNFYVGLFGRTSNVGFPIENLTLLNYNLTQTVSGWVGALVGGDSGTTISNIILSGGQVSGYGSSSAFGTGGVGGLAGYSCQAMIKDSKSSGSVIGLGSGYNFGGILGQSASSSANFFSNNTNSGSVTGYSNVGGLVGNNAESIYNSTNSGYISSSGNVGGIAGYLSGSGYAGVYDSYNSGEVAGLSSSSAVGGIAGYSYSGGVFSTYNTGTIKNNFGGSAGGLVGTNGSCGSVTASYNLGTVSGTVSSTTGGLIGTNSGGTFKGLYESGPTTALVGGLTSVSGAHYMSSLNNLEFATTTDSYWLWNTWNSGTFGAPGAPWFNLTNGAPILTPVMQSDTVTALNSSMQYTGSTYTGTPTVSQSAGPAAMSDFTFSGTFLTATNPGQYTIIPGLASSYSPTSQNSLVNFSFVDGSFTITPAPVVVAPTPTPVVVTPTATTTGTPAYLKLPLTNPIPSLLPIPTEAIATSSAAVTAVTPAPEILSEGVGQNTIGQVQILKNGVKIK